MNNFEPTPIGGYFELADNDGNFEFPIYGVMLNTSRNALEYIIRSLHDAKHVYLPLYTCEAVVEPFKRLPNVGFSFYHINNRFEIADDIQLKDGEYLITNNYFGLKDAYIQQLADKYGDRLIVDNAQALFAPVISAIKAVYSCRKFVGVADGGVAVGISGLDAIGLVTEDTLSHCDHLVIRKEHGAEAGFKNYQHNEEMLDNQPIRLMSHYTREILSHIDYNKLIAKRRANFEYLHMALGEHNQLQLPDMSTLACPMVYPFVGRANVDLRLKLIQNKVFVACYWPNIFDWAKPNDLEYTLAERLVAIPIDQRYGEEDMNRIIEIINNGTDC